MRKIDTKLQFLFHAIKSLKLSANITAKSDTTIIRKKWGKKGQMTIKIDLEKAYDRLNWSFIRDTLEDIGFPNNINQLIWHCISSPTMKVLWNGEALNEFQPERNIRQGDPISPYLFVLCIEMFFHAIEKDVNDDSWRPSLNRERYLRSVKVEFDQKGCCS